MGHEAVKARNLVFDYMRVFCVIWIVGFWHMKAYVENDDYYALFSTAFTFQVTYGVLAAFTFISGYFSYRKYFGIKDVLLYYLKRLVRIWPLFVLSAITLVWIGMNVGKTLFLIIFGFGWIVRPFPTTIWFVCMILVFYLLTPLLSQNNSVLTVVSAIIIEAVFYWLSRSYGTDERMHFYWMYFTLGSFSKRYHFLDIVNGEIAFIGIKLSNNLSADESKDRGCYPCENPNGGASRLAIFGRWILRYMIMGCIPAFIFLGVSSGVTLNYRTAVAGFCFVLSLYVLCYLTSMGRGNRFAKVIERSSYSSMCVYLFHRFIMFELCLHFGGKINIIMAYTAALPVLFIGGYMIQWVYDAMIHFIEARFSRHH